jgi:hypothetical protein
MIYYLIPRNFTPLMFGKLAKTFLANFTFGKLQLVTVHVQDSELLQGL